MDTLNFLLITIIVLALIVLGLSAAVFFFLKN